MAALKKNKNPVRHLEHLVAFIVKGCISIYLGANKAKYRARHLKYFLTNR